MTSISGYAPRFFGKPSKASAKMLSQLPGELDQGEALLALVAVTRMRPATTFVALTSRRVLSINAPTHTPRTWIDEIDRQALTDISIDSRKLLLYVNVVTTFGTLTLGSLASTKTRVDVTTYFDWYLGKDALEYVGAALPAKAVHLTSVIIDDLKSAENAAAAGRILQEEELIFQAQSRSAAAGFGRKTTVSNWIAAQVAAREERGTLRIGAEPIGKVIGTYNMTLRVYSDRFVFVGKRYLFDDLVKASVELDGTLSVTSHQSIGAFGVATSETVQHDSRHAYFILAHPAWTLAVALNPDQAPVYRPLAARINMLANSKVKMPEPISSSTLDELERIAALVASGTIRQDEADVLKARLFNN